jgi:hypothetical protein
MIRSAPIGILGVATFLSAAIWILGLRAPRGLEIRISQQTWVHFLVMGQYIHVKFCSTGGLGMCDSMPDALAESVWKVSDGRRFKIRVFGAKDANFSVPAWIPPIAFSIYPILVCLRGPVRRLNRRRRGLCVKCGYNLTGNTTGTCPECGTKFEMPQRGTGP